MLARVKIICGEIIFDTWRASIFSKHVKLAINRSRKIVLASLNDFFRSVSSYELTSCGFSRIMLRDDCYAKKDALYFI